jgi:transcriptional regulator with PAS, ATPase and Fis domain
MLLIHAESGTGKELLVRRLLAVGRDAKQVVQAADD